MPQFVVKGATVKRENIPNQYGPKKSVDLFLQEYGSDTQVQANWFANQESPVPGVGATVEGEIIWPEPGTPEAQYGPKFKKAPKQHGGAGGGGGGMPPERQRAIQRQHSQDMAIQTLKLAGSLGLLPDVKTTADLFPLLKGTADWFDGDVDRKANPQPEAQT